MSELLAHLLLFGRHRTIIRVGGWYWQYCNHHSHRWGWPCWRWHQWDGYCRKHNDTCWDVCDDDSSTH
jgi:hypothetical protein